MVDELPKTSENWNIAQGYVVNKLLRPLCEMDKFVTIAIYGTEHIEENMNFPPEYLIQMRIQAIRRLIDTLREIITNSFFACNDKGKEVLTLLEERVAKVLEVLHGITHETTDQRTGQKVVQINEKHFNICLEELRKIKKEITIPLNDNGLIFQTSEEISLDTLKERMIHGG